MSATTTSTACSSRTASSTPVAARWIRPMRRPASVPASPRAATTQPSTVMTSTRASVTDRTPAGRARHARRNPPRWRLLALRLLAPRLLVDRGHVRIAVPCGRALGRGFVEPAEVLVGQVDVRGRRVLLQVGDALCAGDRDDGRVPVPPALRHHPRQGQLARRHALLVGDLLHPLDQVQVLLERLALEPRAVPAEVVGGEVVDAADLAGEEAAADR